MSPWFLLYDKNPYPAARNMAIDEYLFDLCHQKHIGFLRIYFWKKPTFSYGVSQKVKKVINIDFIKSNNFSYIRRITGGKVVLHDDEITYSVITSEDFFFKKNDLYKSYMIISKYLVNSFEKIGIPVNLSSKKDIFMSKSNNPCFSFPTQNEIEIGGKKIVGSAQKRDNKALIQHGSIPVSMNYELYAKGTNVNSAIIKKSMTSLSEISNRTKDELIESMISNFSDFISNDIREFNFKENDREKIHEIEKKYISDQWNFSI